MKKGRTYQNLKDRAVDELLKNADCLREIFGEDYNFHDAEILSIQISQNCRVTIKMLDFHDGEQYLIKWTLKKVQKCDLQGYEPRICYIFDVSFIKNNMDQLDIDLDGVGARFVCKSVEFSVKPFGRIPQDKASDMYLALK